MKIHVIKQGLAALALIALLLPGSGGAGLAQRTDEGPQRQARVAAEVLQEFAAEGEASYLVYFDEKPDLSGVEELDWSARGWEVYNRLAQAAERSQAGAKKVLESEGLAYQSFWIDNVLVVESSNYAVFQRIAKAPGVREIKERQMMSLIEPQESAASGGQVQGALGAEPNLVRVKADQAWARGFTGSGVVVANIDTGVRYTHQALVNQYRGSLGGGNFNHNYSWLDPYNLNNQFSAPTDTHGHGTHVMGTMVGSDGAFNQTGMAPGAKWIACRGCSASSCGDDELLACAQFVAAPTDLAGKNPNPDLRAHVVNNSWGDCGRAYDEWFQAAVDNWHAFGVYPVFANGNSSSCTYGSPPGLNTVSNPARYGNVTGVGSTGLNNGQYAVHSNWGPSDSPDTLNPRGYPALKPNVVAPGVSIRSSVISTDSAYGFSSGTSMSAPHVAGLVALVLQANPALKGNYAATETLIEQTAWAVPYASGGFPAPGPGNVPNYATGWGEIDALAAVREAVCGAEAVPTGAACLRIDPAALAAPAAPGASLSRTLTLSNNGAAEVSYSLNLAETPAWLSFSPAAGTVPAQGQAQVEVIFTPPADAPLGAAYQASLSLTSSAAFLTSPTIPLTMQVVEPFHGVQVSPDDEAGGLMGETIIHNLRVTNSGNVADTYLLEIEGGSWAAELSRGLLTLGGGQTGEMTVSVAIPAEAEIGASDWLTFTARSSAGMSASSKITTRAVPPRADLRLEMVLAVQALSPGEVYSYTFAVRNFGPQTATEAVLSGSVPEQVLFEAGVGCSEALGGFSCPLETISSGALKSAAVRLSFPEAGKYELLVQAAGAEADPDPANNQAVVVVHVGQARVFAPLVVRQIQEAGR